MCMCIINIPQSIFNETEETIIFESETLYLLLLHCINDDKLAAWFETVLSFMIPFLCMSIGNIIIINNIRHNITVRRELTQAAKDKKQQKKINKDEILKNLFECHF